jgi:hypothetical protein
MSDGCVISRFKILAYYRVRFAFEAAQGLPSNIIYDFKSRFNSTNGICKSSTNYKFRRRRIGFRHFILESGEENNPENPACLAEAIAKAGRSCPRN